MGTESTTIFFGKYYNNNKNTMTPLEWIVLCDEENSYLLLSKYVIDARAFDKPTHEEMRERAKKAREVVGDNFLAQMAYMNNATWSISTLRYWMNNDFYNAAFSDAEKKRIIVTKNHTKCEKRVSQSGIVDGGPDTEDYVFILSNDDVEKYFTRKRYVPVNLVNPALQSVGQVSQDAVQEMDLETYGTPYAKSKGLYFSNGLPNNSVSDKHCWWWLRSPGGAPAMISVFQSGNILYKPGEKCDDNTIGVRPAIWIKKPTESDKIDQLSEELQKKEKDLLAEKQKVLKKQRELDAKEKQLGIEEDRLTKWDKQLTQKKDELNTKESDLKKQEIQLKADAAEFIKAKKCFEEDQKRAEYRKKGLCQYCGGSFAGVFKKSCSVCKKEKDY